MAKDYSPPKLFNRLSMMLARVGLGGRMEELITTGRRSGRRRSVPISPITVDGNEYLVAPYGEVGWVRNVRTDAEATLRSGRRIRTIRLAEVTGQVPEVVKNYYERERYSRPYMDVPADPELSDFAAKAGDFPVFRIEPT